MNQRKNYIIVLVLLSVTAIFAVIYLLSTEKTEAGTVIVAEKRTKNVVVTEDLPLQPIRGTIKNGKGEERDISSMGIPLSALAKAPYSTVTVSAMDGYSAHFTADETENAYLLLMDDGCLQLAVFSDPDSKRSVKNVIRVDFE